MFQNFDGLFNLYTTSIAFIEALDSRVTFDLITTALIVMLMLALGMSVIGYRKISKIICSIIAVVTLLGFLFIAPVYILLFVISVVCLLLIHKKHQENQVIPKKYK